MHEMFTTFSTAHLVCKDRKILVGSMSSIWIVFRVVGSFLGYVEKCLVELVFILDIVFSFLSCNVSPIPVFS